MMVVHCCVYVALGPNELNFSLSRCHEIQHFVYRVNTGGMNTRNSGITQLHKFQHNLHLTGLLYEFLIYLSIWKHVTVNQRASVVCSVTAIPWTASVRNYLLDAYLSFSRKNIKIDMLIKFLCQLFPYTSLNRLFPAFTSSLSSQCSNAGGRVKDNHWPVTACI